jgi:hypothetical protein
MDVLLDAGTYRPSISWKCCSLAPPKPFLTIIGLAPAERQRIEQELAVQSCRYQGDARSCFAPFCTCRGT